MSNLIHGLIRNNNWYNNWSNNWSNWWSKSLSNWCMVLLLLMQLALWRIVTVEMTWRRLKETKWFQIDSLRWIHYQVFSSDANSGLIRLCFQSNYFQFPGSLSAKDDDIGGGGVPSFWTTVQTDLLQLSKVSFNFKLVTIHNKWRFVFILPLRRFI